MPKFSGLFDNFDNLEKINVENVANFLRKPPQLIFLENYLANRILYPQALPLTEQDLEIDLAILREALKLTVSASEQNNYLGENPFFNRTLKKIMIPKRFLNFIPSLPKLTWAFVDILPSISGRDWFDQLWTIVLTEDTDEVVGSLLIPQFETASSYMQLNLLGRSFQIKAGTLIVIPCLKERCELSYEFNKGKILGKEKNALEVLGGRLGLVIDGRKR